MRKTLRDVLCLHTFLCSALFGFVDLSQGDSRCVCLLYISLSGLIKYSWCLFAQAQPVWVCDRVQVVESCLAGWIKDFQGA